MPEKPEGSEATGLSALFLLATNQIRM